MALSGNGLRNGRFLPLEDMKKEDVEKLGDESKPGYAMLEGDDEEILQQAGRCNSSVNQVYIKGLGLFILGERRSGISGKIIAITGGAMGYGEGIARELFNDGATIILLDINEEAGRIVQEDLNSLGKSNPSLFVKANVTNFESMQEAVFKTVLAFGGLDVMISNAGVLKAGGIEEMDEDSFDFVTSVNYKGYFNCVKAATPVMKAQNKQQPANFGDIIQINSKSGLQGSKKNFAYAGGKFAGIGLTQSFALELMPERIKVNAVCPGNFFEGPLWSDPEKGLFVQYLKAGKVAGAKTVDDVKRHYESLVPAGRGCRVNDVVKAIKYIIDQEYETGQAIPVTGGQTMLN
jgi:sorbitol-6-phosphate 2-dehydrogenase